MSPQSGQSSNAPMGANIVGQYALERPLGQGGMAEVWLARNLHLGTPAAIKFLNRAYAGHPEIEQRFLNEGRRQGSLNHPNIVKVYGFEYVGGRSFLILQYIDGEALDRLLQRVGRLDPRDAVRIATGVLNALECAHANNIVHRDIKPSNILLDGNGFPYLGDFGIVLALNEKRVTKAGTVMGTSYYMSPEQITAPSRIDARSDIYSVGCVLYEMLTGRPPFEVASTGQGDTDFAIKMAHVQQTPAPLRAYNPSVPPQIDRVVMQCLAKDPNYRFQSCGQLRDALNAAIGGPVEPPKKQSAIWMAIAIPALLVLIGVAVWVWMRFYSPSFVVENVSICQGVYDASKDACQADPTSRDLTVYGNYHGAKPKESTVRVEWTLDGKVVAKPDPHFLSGDKGWYHHDFGNAEKAGLYEATVYAGRVRAGSQSIRLGAPTFGIDTVAICQGTYSAKTGCQSDSSSRVLTLYTHFHDAKVGVTTLREDWELNGTVVERPEAYVLPLASGVYHQQYGTAKEAGDYKVTLYADNAPIGSAVAHIAAAPVIPQIPQFPANTASMENVSICQGKFDSKTAACTSDPYSKELTAVAHFHGATPGQTKVGTTWMLNGRSVEQVPVYALTHDKGFYYDPFTANTPGDYKAEIYLDGVLAGSAQTRVAAPQAGLAVDSVTICRGSFDRTKGECLNNPSSNQLGVVFRFHGATPNQTQVQAVWSLFGTEIQKSSPFTLHYEHGWYNQGYGTARVWGDYKVTIYVDGVARGSAVAHVGL